MSAMRPRLRVGSTSDSRPWRPVSARPDLLSNIAVSGAALCPQLSESGTPTGKMTVWRLALVRAWVARSESSPPYAPQDSPFAWLLAAVFELQALNRIGFLRSVSTPRMPQSG